MDFGDNQGNVIFMGISKGDFNKDVIAFDQTYGITFPSVSGFEGNGNQVHLSYLTQSTPTVIVIQPNRYIHNQGVWPPTQENITAAVVAAGGMLVGIEDQANEPGHEISIYPNPVIDDATITLKLVNNASVEVEVINLAGERVIKSDPMHGKSGIVIVRLSLGHLPGGLYLVRLVRDGEPMETRKLVIK